MVTITDRRTSRSRRAADLAFYPNRPTLPPSTCDLRRGKSHGASNRRACQSAKRRGYLATSLAGLPLHKVKMSNIAVDLLIPLDYIATSGRPQSNEIGAQSRENFIVVRRPPGPCPPTAERRFGGVFLRCRQAVASPLFRNRERSSVGRLIPFDFAKSRCGCGFTAAPELRGGKVHCSQHGVARVGEYGMPPS
jgi:hypothetical protein